MKHMQFLRVFASWVKTFFDFLYNNLKFSELSRKRARLGLLIVSGILVIGIGLFEPVGVHPMLDPGIGVFISAVLAFLVGAGLLLTIRIILVIPRFFRDWGILFMGAILGYLALTFPTP